MDILLGHFLGLACRPTDLTIALIGWSLFPRDSNPILAGGSGVARFWWFGLFLCLVLFMGNFYVSVLCLSRDWARCRAALGANKNVERGAPSWL